MLLTLAAAYDVALVPMFAVYAGHVGVPLLLAKLLIWAPLLLVVSVLVGVLIGVLFIGRSIAAPAATGMGILLVYAALVPLQELLTAQGNGASRSGHVALASPAVLLKNGLGFALAIGTVPASTWRTWLALAIVVSLALALAAWTFLRAQGVETWEATRGQRWIIGAGLRWRWWSSAVVVGDTNYDKTAPPINNAPAIRGVFSRAGSSLGLATPGGRLPERCCSTILNRDEWPSIGTDEVTRKELFVLLPVDAREQISDLRLEVAGANGLEVVVDPAIDAANCRRTSRIETRVYPNDAGPPRPSGVRIATGLVVRVPIGLRPTHPWDTGGMRYPIDVTATYRVGREPAPRVLKARAAIEAQITRAGYEMGVASMILPVVCFGAAFRRWRRTR